MLIENIMPVLSDEDWTELSQTQTLRLYRSESLRTALDTRLIDRLQWSSHCVLVTESGETFLVQNTPFDHCEFGEMDRLSLTKCELYTDLSGFELVGTIDAPGIALLREQFEIGSDRKRFTSVIGLLIRNSKSDILVTCVDGASIGITTDTSLVQDFLNELTLMSLRD